MEREIKRIGFRIKNTQQLNEDDKSLLNELKDVNGGGTVSNNNSSAQQKLVDALTKILNKNKERASDLLDTNKKSVLMPNLLDNSFANVVILPDFLFVSNKS
ncbi:hypothetical protein, partial [Mycoplasmopsis bovis]|uniref:hypothetical protein n=1 Tax=Mycoplasmopsis bovis TaxID=28903 RepID=UPI003D2BB44C